MQNPSKHSNNELWLSFAAILVITLVYFGVVVWLESIPPASDLFGHGLGILGFILMLATEILYSIRKRSRRARWGRMSSWLNIHIFTGIVGPYMVLLHTSWEFNGLAGLTLLLTVLVVVSGFIGRYIYTAIPRSAEGVELEAEWLEQATEVVRGDLQRWLSIHPREAVDLARRLGLGDLTPDQAVDQLLTSFHPSLLQRLRWRWALRGQAPAARRSAQQIESLLQEQSVLRKQTASLAMARRMLSLWHTIHIPFGLVLFTAAFIHIGAAFYYATLLR